MKKIIEQNNEYRIVEINGITRRDDAHCPDCKFSKKVNSSTWNCYEGGCLKMCKKDDTKAMKLFCMNWCSKFEWK